MKFVLAASLLFASAFAAQAGPASDAVVSFYKNPDAAFDAEQRDRFVDPARALLDANDRVWEEQQEACIGFSFVIDGQDWDEDEITSTLELTESVEGDGAIVMARFSNFGETRTLEWTLERSGRVWRVADIMSLEGDWRLSELTCE
jgi:hypothetical protein